MVIKYFGNMKNQVSDLKKFLFIFLLVFLAIGERLWFDLGPNVELITTTAVLTSIYFNYRFSIIISLMLLALTDSLMGNTPIMLFTWSAFIIEALAVSFFAKKSFFKEKKLMQKLLFSSKTAIGVSFWFYLWTNFGVWFLNNWQMYPKTLAGLIACYLAGLPFLNLHLLSNLFFLPLFMFVWEFFFQLQPFRQTNQKTLLVK